MSLPTLSYAKTSSLYMNAPSSSSASAMPPSSFSLPAAWHAMVDHGSGKRKAADSEYQLALDWLQGEIDRITTRHKIDCAVDVRSSKRVKRDTDSHSADETKAERRQRIETAQQEAIAHQQQQLLATTPDEPVPVPVQSVQQPVGAEEPTGQENVPPPMAVKSKAGKAGKGKGRAVRKGKKASADGTDESEAESAVAVSDVDPPTTASERDDDEGETAKRTRTRPAKVVDSHIDSAVKHGKKASRTRATKKATDDRPTEVEEGRTTRTRAAARRAEVEKEKERGKDKELVDVVETKKAKRTVAGKRKKDAEPPTPKQADTTPTAVAVEDSVVVTVQQVESVVEVVEVVEKEDTEMAIDWRKDEQRSSMSKASASIKAAEVAMESLLAEEVVESEPLPAKRPAEYPTLSTIIPSSTPPAPLSPPPVPSPTSSASLLSPLDDKPAEPARSAGLVSWLKAPFSLLGIGGGSAMKKETLTLASVTPAAMLAPALRSSPSSSPATSPVSSPAPSPASSPVLQPISAPIAALPPLTSAASLPPPLPTCAPGATVESAAAANAKTRKEELKAKLEASKQQMKDKIEEARALGSGGSNHSGSVSTTPTSTPTTDGTAPSSVSLGAERKASVEAAAAGKQTAEHIQVIDIVEQADEHASPATDPQQPQREEGSHFVVAPTSAVVPVETQQSVSSTAAMDITLLSSSADVTMIELDEAAIDDTADVTMTDDAEAKRDDRGEATIKAKSSRTETLKKKDMKEKQLEAARKREEVEKRRRQLEEAERRKQEEKEEERRKKEEQLKKAKQQQATDKKKAATLKPAANSTTTTATTTNKNGAASTKKKDDKKDIAKTLPTALSVSSAAVGGSAAAMAAAAARSATLPEPLTIVDFTSISYTAKEDKDRRETVTDEDDEWKQGDEEKEPLVLSTYAPIQPAASDTHPPPLPPPLSNAVKAMLPPPPLPSKPALQAINNQSTQPTGKPLVKFHPPTATSHTTSHVHTTTEGTTGWPSNMLPPPKPYQTALTTTGQQAAASDSSMSPPPARLPHTKTPPHTHTGTGAMLPPPLPVPHTPEHGKLLPPSSAATLHPPLAASASSSSSSSTPQQPKPKTSPQSYVFSPPPKPLLSPDSNNYPMSDHDNSDYSDDETSSAKKRDARIPGWAKEPQLAAALRAQQMAAVDPDSIFPPIDPFSMSLHEIFKGYKRKKRFRERTSSGNWQMDQLSVREEMQYKRDMGYVKANEAASVSVASTATVASVPS